jgi:hypothetical protein
MLSDKSKNMADDDEKKGIVIIWPRRVKKRKVQAAFKDLKEISIDYEDDTYKQASLGPRV